MDKLESENFKAVANSNLARCFIPVDGQELRPDSLFFVKAGADWSPDYNHFLGTNGMPDGVASRFRFHLGERLAVPDDNSDPVSLRGPALKADEPRLLRRSDNGEGYSYVNSSRYSRIVWEAHMGAIPDGLEVDHMNRVRNDDRLANLRLVTHGDNLRNSRVTRRSNWKQDDRVLLIDTVGGNPLLVHPTKVNRDLTHSNNIWKVLHGDRLSDKGWYVVVNPTAAMVDTYFSIVLKDRLPSRRYASLRRKCLTLVA